MSNTVSAPRQRILVPMDFSETAVTALKQAIRLAQPAAGDIVQVLYVPGFYLKTPTEASVVSNPFCGPAQIAGRHFLALAKAESPEVLVEALPLTEIPDAASIADVAIRMGSTLIVLARRVYSLWDRVRGKCPAITLSLISPCPIHLVERQVPTKQ